MSWLVPLLLVVVVGLPLVVAFRRMGELFVLRAHRGRLVVVRGRVPQRLLDDLRDVVQKAGVQDAVLRCVVDDGRPRIQAPRGTLDATAEQQLRNILGMWPLAKIRAAPRRR